MAYFSRCFHVCIIYTLSSCDNYDAVQHLLQDLRWSNRAVHEARTTTTRATMTATETRMRTMALMTRMTIVPRPFTARAILHQIMRLKPEELAEKTLAHPATQSHAEVKQILGQDRTRKAPKYMKTYLSTHILGRLQFSVGPGPPPEGP